LDISSQNQIILPHKVLLTSIQRSQRLSFFLRYPKLILPWENLIASSSIRWKIENFFLSYESFFQTNILQKFLPTQLRTMMWGQKWSLQMVFLSFKKSKNFFIFKDKEDKKKCLSSRFLIFVLFIVWNIIQKNFFLSSFYLNFFID